MYMKKFTYLLFSIVLIALASCDDYLNRPTKTDMNDETYWSSEQNVRLFVNGGYTNYFPGYSSSWSTNYVPGVRGELSDDATKTNKQSNILINLPADNWFRKEGTDWLQRTGAAPWNFGWVRKWNLLIDRLVPMHENGILNDEQYNHWNGVARFLRGFEYSLLVQSFGDVPYYDFVVESADFDSQYKDRDPRTEVMQKVMEDFDYAIANIRTDDGNNHINKYVAAAYASRFMLFEGTWYIYHPGSGTDALAKTFLEKTVEYANVVINSGLYKFDTDFRTLFGSETKVGNEILMYRYYSAEQSVRHCIASYSNLEENQDVGANLSTLKAWLCADGQPYTSSTLPDAQSWELKNMAKTRDPRFEATFWDEPTSGNTGIYCVKFIDRIGPTYSFDSNTETRPAKYGSNTNTNGFPCMRYAEVVLNYIEAKAELADKFGGAAVTQNDLDISINAIRDRPLDQEAIDKGVQKTAHLILGVYPDDPIRTSDPEKNTLAGVVESKLIWEIRRERRMEFCLEQRRLTDLRRWGKLELMQGSNNPDILVGAWCDLNTTDTLKKSFNLLTASNFGTLKIKKTADPNVDDVVTFDGQASDAGDITSSNASEMVGFRIPTSISDRDPILPRNYLEPICSDVINQYKDRGYTITQNPGWEQ